MIKKILTLNKQLIVIVLLCLFVMTTLIGCGAKTETLNLSDKPETEVSIDGKNSDDITGFTYLYDYGNGFRLYADNYTKIVYIIYYGKSGSGSKATNAVGMTPWLSENGKYCYVDVEDKSIKELNTDDTVDIKSNDDEDDNTSDNTKQSTPITDQGDSSNIDKSVTDKINQNTN